MGPIPEEPRDAEPGSAPPPASSRWPFPWLRNLVLLQRRARFVVVCFLWALVAMWALAWLFSGFFRAPNIRALSREARDSGITYLQALHDPAVVSKPVRWHLTHVPPAEWYHEGNHSEPVVWAGAEPELPFTGQSGSQNYLTVLATVAGSDGKQVQLSFIGQD